MDLRAAQVRPAARSASTACAATPGAPPRTPPRGARAAPRRASGALWIGVVWHCL